MAIVNTFNSHYVLTAVATVPSGTERFVLFIHAQKGGGAYDIPPTGATINGQAMTLCASSGTYQSTFWCPAMLHLKTITRFTAYLSSPSNGNTTIQAYAYNASANTGLCATATIAANNYASNAPAISSTYKYLREDSNIPYVTITISGTVKAKGLQLNFEVL